MQTTLEHVVESTTPVAWDLSPEAVTRYQEAWVSSLLPASSEECR